MRYWDSSALISLIVDEEASALRRRQLRDDPAVVTWWTSRVECASALSRLKRERALSSEDLAAALGRLDVLAGGWAEVQPRERLRRRALRLLRVHVLRAADALQLAAALAACREEPGSMPLVCGDGRLAGAARVEGFAVL